MTCANARRPVIGTTVCMRQGGASVRCTPPWRAVGCAGSATLDPVSIRASVNAHARLGRAPYALGVRRPRLPRLRAWHTWSPGSVGGAAPAPAPHGRTWPVSPGVGRGRHEGPEPCLGPQTTLDTLGHRRSAGARTSRRVWCSHLRAPARGHPVRTRGRGPTMPAATRRQQVNRR
jgi:hypothetical protein